MKTSQTPTHIPIGPALVSPGEILDEEFLKPMGLSQSALAERMIDRDLLFHPFRSRPTARPGIEGVRHFSDADSTRRPRGRGRGTR